MAYVFEMLPDGGSWSENPALMLTLSVLLITVPSCKYVALVLSM